MRHSFSCLVAISLVLGASGCSDGDGADPADAAVFGDSASTSADGGEMSNASVNWVTEPEPITIDRDIGLDFFWQYELDLDAPTVYTLTLERCITIAGTEENCSTEPLPTTAGPTGGVRWGIDPSMYAIGENRWRFTLRLDRGAQRVDEDSIELVANVTACTECIQP